MGAREPLRNIRRIELPEKISTERFRNEKIRTMFFVAITASFYRLTVNESDQYRTFLLEIWLHKTRSDTVTVVLF